MNFKSIPNKFENLNWQEIETIAKDKRSTIIWPFGAVEQHDRIYLLLQIVFLLMK